MATRRSVIDGSVGEGWVTAEADETTLGAVDVVAAVAALAVELAALVVTPAEVPSASDMAGTIRNGTRGET